MQFGIHLPQFGRAAGPDSIRKAAIEAEQQGYDDIWISDHLAVPTDAPYPPTAYIYEPLISLTWVPVQLTQSVIPIGAALPTLHAARFPRGQRSSCTPGMRYHPAGSSGVRFRHGHQGASSTRCGNSRRCGAVGASAAGPNASWSNVVGSSPANRFRGPLNRGDQ